MTRLQDGLKSMLRMLDASSTSSANQRTVSSSAPPSAGETRRAAPPPFRWFSEEAIVDPFLREEERNAHVVAQPWFNGIIVVLTVLCSFLLGFELDRGYGIALKDRIGYFFADVFFAMAFMGEMFLRQHQLGWDYFLDLWNVFDFSLVVLNFSDVFVALGDEDGGFQISATLRVLRLVKIARFVQGIQSFQSMWMLIEGLTNSLRTMVWTGFLLVIIIYTFSVFCMVLITDDPELVERFTDRELYLGSVYRSMLTMCQVFTLDGWATDLARPLIMVGNMGSVVIIILCLVICNMGVLNIIIAIMVERISVMKEESEARNERILTWVERNILQFLFDDFSRGSSRTDGLLEYKHFRQVVSQPEVAYKLRVLGLSVEEADSYFELLDVQRRKRIDLSDFCEGLRRLKGEARGIDIVSLITFSRKQVLKSKEYLKKVRIMHEKADRMQAFLDHVGLSLRQELLQRRDEEQRAVEVRVNAHTWQGLLSYLEHDYCVKFPNVEMHDDEDYYDDEEEDNDLAQAQSFLR